MLDTLTALVEAGAAAPWVLPVVALLATVDALVPPVPSEGLLVALAAVAVAGAAAVLERRGAAVVLTARYVPLGRVAVNLTAGATGFPPRRFVGLAALAAATWAAWSVGVGAVAGRWLEGSPLLGSAAGVLVALGLGLLVDRLVRRLTGWGRMPVPPASAAAPAPAPSFALSTGECQ